MKEFIRTEDYLAKVFMDAFDGFVIQDALIDIRWSHLHNKYKAYCLKTNTYLQFPTALRKPGAQYIADIVKSKKDTGTIFYRAYRNSIRDSKTGVVVG